MQTRILIAICAVALMPSSGHAISDDANPWLAIENALCVRHRTVDYSSLIGVPVRFQKAEWTGASDGMPTHCHIAGDVQGAPFDIKLPVTWNGHVFPKGCEPTTPSNSASVDALDQGTVSAFGRVSGATTKLMRAVSKTHYRFDQSLQAIAACE